MMQVAECNKGKMVQIHHGPATVIGDEAQQTPLDTWEGMSGGRSVSQETCLYHSLYV
jgi:hypothetical protein